VKGTLYSLVYGKVSHVNIEPVEKKPLFHFLPGTSAFSVGGIGCNLRCIHCQNWDISQEHPELKGPFSTDSFSGLKTMTPQDVVKNAHTIGTPTIAYTFNEPTIWFEFNLECAFLARKAGLYNVYVSNGYIQEAPFREIARFLDGINIDIKAFNEDTYVKLSKARLPRVKETALLARELGIHLELTYLVIPGVNDDPGELRSFARWVRDELSPATPIHFTRFHPDHKLKDLEKTPLGQLFTAYKTSREEGLENVYLGNIPASKYSNSLCPSCGTEVITRQRHKAQPRYRPDGSCQKCGYRLNLFLGRKGGARAPMTTIED